MARRDQSTDNDVGGGGNATFKTTSKSPTHGQSQRFRGPEAYTVDPSADNEWYKAVPGREIPDTAPSGALEGARNATKKDRDC